MLSNGQIITLDKSLHVTVTLLSSYNVIYQNTVCLSIQCPICGDSAPIHYPHPQAT